MNNQTSSSSGELNNATLSDRVYVMMADAIIRGEYPPGSRLIEINLAERYQISRGPLREAMRRLDERRLIVRTARHGARVAELSSEVLAEISMVRELLESAACRLAAENMSDDEIKQLNAIVDSDATLVAQGETYYRTESTLDIHFCIVRGARNSIIEGLLCRELYPLIRMYRYQHKVVEGRADSALKEHRAIVDAISNRDGELAQLLMLRHLASSRKHLLDAITLNPQKQSEAA
ncbi:GntR family transcriptional regulator [Pollutimonas nitritireducens]|uniref:GntR family transcriptional regulator n=1 Tax=Pollutimonas nitritireducens TaxID=2045209 RepID=A0A2N4UC82_9BURK|nr:GntR family transcriptional regulator [Pollutimonas nitritireducens]PLC52632.1 GntR family transcriptional regulator [Pollutimonas nitritireducens]